MASRRSRLRVATVLGAALAAALVAAGCGSPSASQVYTKKLETTCARYVSTAAATTSDPLAQVRQLVHDLDVLLPKLAALQPTPDTRARSRTLLAEMKQLRAIEAVVYTDLAKGDQRNFAALERRYERIAAKLHSTATALGTPSCSKAANPRD